MSMSQLKYSKSTFIIFKRAIIHHRFSVRILVAETKVVALKDFDLLTETKVLTLKDFDLRVTQLFSAAATTEHPLHE